MHEIQNSAIPLIEQFGSYAAIIAFFASFGETLIGIGWLLPGSTILLIMGVLADQGYFDFTTTLIAESSFMPQLGIGFEVVPESDSQEYYCALV